ncbi:tRNA (adenosine(37)-N6)-threonylcarbamoyltransferase complex ATPase subunit type 1 TsaE [Halarcobacter ebronensis]|uniref:tRNA (adenosine(37)-N6)-threonylcarbamoyltransferase complex ATPase subunit type 1 TsaE n=1 Tax=Halarcobacter ebronensis TaxID=1462615 RepID=UPI0019D6B3CA|nr:tRNA (adenosine(37)-N6)-threonylcarbamoyltransferase complex ATPase subunit type 1 TsaE [Halarcobacter ebronensis]QKF81977.1 N6-L-threonylcarbamoyladenine synthase, TsaE subunit [Halarcobacter ebronensis]
MEILAKIDEIDKVVAVIKELIASEDTIVILRGDLASGKTTFVKSFVKNLDIDELVTSPTFSIQSIYANTIYHYDVYNKTLEEFISLGLLEEFDKKGVHFIEWGDEKLEELLKSYGFKVLVLKIEKREDKRLYIINE